MISVVAGKRKKIDESQLLNLRHVRRAGELFAELRDVGCQRDTGDNRKLFFSDYCSWILFYAMNPAIDSMRMLQLSSELERTQSSLGLQRFSIGAFSEAPDAFDASRLKPIAAQLSVRMRQLGTASKHSDFGYVVQLADSTLLRTLPKLAKTRYVQRRDGEQYHGWRVHMELEVGFPSSSRFTVTGARKGGDERKVLKRHVRRGCCYVTDRGYHDVGLFNEIHDHESRYVCRVKDGLKHIVLDDLDLSDEQRAAGVISDQIVLMGQDRQQPPNHVTRLVIVKAEVHPKRTARGTQDSSGRILLVTDLTSEESCAEEVGLLYHYRWTIELFFRFLKQILGMNHLLGHSEEAVRIFVYCMVISCMLLFLWTGLQPNKAMVMMLSFYLTGLASLEELIRFIERQRKNKTAS